MKKKKPVLKKNPSNTQNTIQNEMNAEEALMIKNGLSDAIMGTDPTFGSQLSQTDTLFKNNRWYLISNLRQLLSEIYVEHGLIKTVVDLPVDDGLRAGFEIHTKMLDPEQIDQLQADMERKDDLQAMGQALKWNRLFGGAGVLIITDQDPKTPFDIKSITEDTPLEFRAVDMWELFHDMMNTDPVGSTQDETLRLKQVKTYNYYGMEVHESRVMKLKGLEAPSFIRPRLRGWGFSIVESMVRSINQYLKATDLTFEVLDEFKLDIYKIKGLTSTLLNPNGAAKVFERVSLANRQKNYQNAITMDAEDDYQQKQLTFAGISETMDGIRKQIASDLRMPLTKIFGISAAGFSSGEDDIENYNSMVESDVRCKAKYHLLKIVQIRCQQLFGFIPEDLRISFPSLRILSTEQEENVKTMKFARALQARQAGELTQEEFRDIINKENLLGIKLNKDDSVMQELEKIEPEKVPSSMPKG